MGNDETSVGDFLKNLKVKNSLYNLATLQTVYGAGSIRAYKIYKILCENKLISMNLDDILKSDVIDIKEREKIKAVKRHTVGKIFIDCENNGINILSICDDAYPERLRNIQTPPLILYIKGSLPDIDNEPVFCIVGPRKISEFGKRAAYSLSYRLARSGMIIVSGGALGGDTHVHTGALKSGGKTLAVLGCGIMSDYLSANNELRNKIAENCCLVSEYPPYQKATKYSFPIRNRIMSGLSLGVAVVEAGEKSGTLVTAKHANEQGRDVFVIPGNPTDINYKGSNNLLRDGAKPLIDASDVFNEYIPQFPEKIDLEKAFKKDETQETKQKSLKKEKNLSKGLSKEAKIVYNYLDKQNFTADDLLGLDISDEKLICALTELEFEHYIKANFGGTYTIIK